MLQTATLNNHYLMDEDALVSHLLPLAALSDGQKQQASRTAEQLIGYVRDQKPKATDINQLLLTYNLSSDEGVALMCVAEALLRIPDNETKNDLLSDKIADEHWRAALQKDSNPFTQFTGWGLSLTGAVMNLDDPEDGWGLIGKAIKRLGEPVMRSAMTQAVKLMGNQFVLGQTIDEALTRGGALRDSGYTHSFDMLGESARTDIDARHYLSAYENAIRATGAAAPLYKHGGQNTPSVSIKLSALHPKYDYKNMDRVMGELYPRVRQLCLLARECGIALTVDAEEADRLLPSLTLLDALWKDDALKGWNGLGLAVQAYSKRALPTLHHIAGIARDTQKRIPVRLVKGAYWDSEIKWAQTEGLDDYPLFTRKAATDVSYLACAKYLLANTDVFYPQFATHNAYSVACILALADRQQDFEFQRLHGMGDALYDALQQSGAMKNFRCRIYAPVGPHQDLLAYLVRRLLENGANSSFVYQIADKNIPIPTLLMDPVEKMQAAHPKRNPLLPKPTALYTPRRNAMGINLPAPDRLETLHSAMTKHAEQSYTIAAIINGKAIDNGIVKTITNPADRRQIVGTVCEADASHALAALHSAANGQLAWDLLGGTQRAAILERAADLFEDNHAHLIGLICREGGRTLQAAIADWREAIDFLRYYAAMARKDFSAPAILPGPTGERNELWLRGRGVFLCIAPWNFPLAIFTGQIAAALAAGNSVLAKPANQTPITAHAAIALLHQAGVPHDCLHFLPASGSMLGQTLLTQPALKGVAFTGSNATAKTINRALAERDDIIPFIAETGGQNCMIVGSSALPEQAAMDVLQSAFDSAGQRCSALRVVFVQNAIADRFIALLTGGLAEMKMGNPALLATDIGPVIDDAALQSLQTHIDRMKTEAKLIATLAIDERHQHGSFMAPHIFELTDIKQLKAEVFGPVLHIIRFEKNTELPALCDAINSTGFGLTVGVHSRLDHVHHFVRDHVRAGNYYVNRNMIGAVVGVQPFGGEGLSGTGPKAGGPHYLYRFATERTVSINTTAAGGNASLLGLADG